jgi:hypothetical protein
VLTTLFQFFSEDCAVASVLNLLNIYLDKDLQMFGSTDLHGDGEFNSDVGSNGSVEDVIVKVMFSKTSFESPNHMKIVFHY